MKCIDSDATILQHENPGDTGRNVRGFPSRSWMSLSLCFAALGLATADLPKDKGIVERLKANVYYLSSDTLEGRGISTPGVDLAAQHIRAEFRRLGLKSGPSDGSYFQPIEYRRSPESARTILKNVIGVLEGKGDLADQAIVIGAHYDHLGHGEFSSLAPEALRARTHPGADDNASGIAAMLELARHFASQPTPSRRRMVFVAFTAEEAGLIGSRHYVSKEPIFPIKDTVAMLNFDMVGRLRANQLGIAGNETAKEFGQILSDADARSPLNLLLGGADYPDDSDHAPFANVGVPILYICTGSHEDRHTPFDTADKVDFEGIAEVVGLCEDVLGRLLVLPRPNFISAKRASSPTSR
jgi:Peptidase family M28